MSCYSWLDCFGARIKVVLGSYGRHLATPDGENDHCSSDLRNPIETKSNHPKSLLKPPHFTTPSRMLKAIAIIQPQSAILSLLQS